MRDPYWDIVKGLGIIAVVAAHAHLYSMQFNWFHLEVFFFVSGFLLNPKKCTDYGNFSLHKLKTLWKPFVMYNIVFFALNDFFMTINWIVTEDTVDDWIAAHPDYIYNKAVKTFTMMSVWISIREFPLHIIDVIFKGVPAVMCGATWFMAPFFVNLLLFGYLVKITYNKSAWQLPALLLLFFASGVAIINHSQDLPLYSDMAMFLLPITAAGFYLKKFCSEKNIHVAEIFSARPAIGGSIAALTVFALLEHEQKFIALAGYKMGNWLIFNVAAFAGIFLTMFAARIILMSNLYTKIFAYIGKRSFHIMALHFVGFKILTSLYVFFYNGNPVIRSVTTLPEVYGYYYTIFGIGIPLIFCEVYSKMKRRFL